MKNHTNLRERKLSVMRVIIVVVGLVSLILSCQSGARQIKVGNLKARQSTGETSHVTKKQNPGGAGTQEYTISIYALSESPKSLPQNNDENVTLNVFMDALQTVDVLDSASLSFISITQ